MAVRQVDRSGALQRLADARVPLWTVGLLAIAGAVATMLFGAILVQPARPGTLREAAAAIAAVPETLVRLAGSLAPYRPSIRPPYEKLPGGLWRNAAQPLVDRGYLLVTDFDPSRARRVIRLVRLSDGKVVHDYAPRAQAIHAGSTFKSPLTDLKRDKTDRLYFPMHPMLMPDGGLIVHDTSPLVRIDACGRPEWMIDGIFHHSIERAPDGGYWATYREPLSRIQRVGPGFAEEGIAHVSAEGRLTGRESIVDILDRNGFGQWWRGHPYTDDPFHLNDIQPVFADGPYWQRGDLFISLRNLSVVLLYRPSTGRILWRRAAPWTFQHDVSVLDDHRIQVFDNHWRPAWDQPEQAEVDGTNRIVVYDFVTDTASDAMPGVFPRLDIRTHSQGRATPLPGGDVMVEETEKGRVMRLAPDGTIRWRYISADDQRRRYELRWSRYLDPTSDAAGIQAAMSAKCS